MKEPERTFVIRNNAILNSDWDKRKKSDVETIIITSDFDTDIDASPKFSRFPSLKNFEIENKEKSPFVVINNVLYLILTPETKSKAMLDDACENYEGLALVCCPPQNTKNLVIHESCSVILSSAFFGCEFDSVTIPNSMKLTFIAAFYGVKIKEIYVPDKYHFVDVAPDHNSVSPEVIIKCNNGKRVDKNVENYWRNNLTDNEVCLPTTFGNDRVYHIDTLSPIDDICDNNKPQF